MLSSLYRNSLQMKKTITTIEGNNFVSDNKHVFNWKAKTSTSHMKNQNTQHTKYLQTNI